MSLKTEVASTNRSSHPQLLADEFTTGFRSDALHLIILPTEQCNFRCTYCYEDFEIGKMQPHVVRGVKRLLERRLRDLHQLSISWFGGEPLIALSVVEDISGFARDLCQLSATLNYEAGMTTNAYRLSLSTAERLYALGVKHYQVTLDGPKEAHDQVRVLRSGKGSFTRIWENLVAIRSSSLPIRLLLRAHVTQANVSSMPRFLETICDTFLDDARFTVVLKTVERWGGPHDAQVPILPEGPERETALTQLENIILERCGKPRLYDEPEVCYAARANSFVIRATGAVGKCTVALSDPANTIGQLLPDGTLRLERDRLTPWLRGWQNADWNALGCPLVGLPRTAGPVAYHVAVRPPALIGRSSAAVSGT